MSADVMVRDINGNTLYKAEMPKVPYNGFSIIEAHTSDTGTLIITIDIETEDMPR